MLRKSLIAGVVLVMGMTGNILYSVAVGAEQSKSISKTSGEGTTYTTTHEVSQVKMVLDGKGKDYVLFCRRKFEVTSNTVIKGEMGMEISFKALSVPCEAMVSYYEKPSERNTYVAVSIEVQGKPKPQPE